MYQSSWSSSSSSTRHSSCFCGFIAEGPWYRYQGQDHADLLSHVVEIVEVFSDGERRFIDSLSPGTPIVSNVRCSCGHKKRSHRNTSEWNPHSPCLHVDEDKNQCRCRSYDQVEFV